LTAELVDTLRAAIETSNASAITRAYHRSGLTAPTILWGPTDVDLDPPELKFLLSYWTGLKVGGDPPRHASIDPSDMWSALGFIMILEAIEGGADFRYRLYGSKIADRSKIDMTGKRLSEFAIHPTTRAFFMAGYRAVMNRREPLKTFHAHAPEIAITSTTRLILPLANADGAVTRFLVGNIPGEWRTPI